MTKTLIIVGSTAIWDEKEYDLLHDGDVENLLKEDLPLETKLILRPFLLDLVEDLINGFEPDELTKSIIDYYKKRNLRWPSSSEAIDWHDTEMGEAQNLILSRDHRWIRNHPENTPKWDPREFAEELGDAIMMLIVAGIRVNQDPIRELKDKMKRKLEELDER